MRLAALGFGDIGADVREASAACAASQCELKRAAEVISAEILRLERVHRQVVHLVSRLEERLACVRPAA
jgi:hypothetical protein